VGANKKYISLENLGLFKLADLPSLFFQYTREPFPRFLVWLEETKGFFINEVPEVIRMIRKLSNHSFDIWFLDQKSITPTPAKSAKIFPKIFLGT
jgi:hypothetical protein